MHQSVLLKESVASLQIQQDGLYIDGTFGRGGHSQFILGQLGPQGCLIVMDKDPEAIAHAHKILGHDARVKAVQASFTQALPLIESLHRLGQVNGILLDLGVSSPQLDQSERGFSFLQEGPLDMRMDNTRGLSVAELLATIEEQALADILWKFGDEKASHRIARAICRARQEGPLATTRQLAQVIEKVMPGRHVLGKHPATRSFQALRIYVNDELNELETILHQAEKLLAHQGRLSVISFHSTEDRLVKRFMQMAVEGPPLPRGLPLTENQILREQKWLWCIKMQKPSDVEIAANPRARSALLRVIEKR